MSKITSNTIMGMIPLMMMAQPKELSRPDGSIHYSLHGEGSVLIIAIPGIGDNQNQYRFMVPQWVEAGYQVATVDLRGHGASTTNWSDYSSAANGSDIVTLIDEIGAEQVVLVGNSIGGAASVWVAAERPNAVKAIVMINPFVEDAKMAWYEKALFKIMFAKPWGKKMWLKFYTNNHPSQKPADFDDHLAELNKMLSRPGGYSAFASTLWSAHARAAKRIPEVKAPVKVIIGSKDPDFKNPSAELEKLQKLFDADTAMIEGAGHYPHVEFPEITGNGILEYLGDKINAKKL